MDSEHSALAQCLRAGTAAEVRRLVLTASGGPFRGRSRAELTEVTPAQALAHPTWNMGQLVTTNSATLVNKGLEVIEAHLLFGVPYDAHRGDGAPAVGRALDGRVRRRLDHRPGLAAGHAAADLAGAGLARPGARRRAGPGLDDGAHLDVRPARRPTAFPAVALARRAGDGRRAAPRRCSTRPTRSWSPPFTGETSDSSPSSTRCAKSWTNGCKTRHARPGEPESVEQVEAADTWARAVRVGSTLGG